MTPRAPAVTELIQQLEAAATCRLLHSHARVTGLSWDRPREPAVRPHRGALLPHHVAAMSEHPKGKHLETSCPRKPDRRSKGFRDPASGGRAA